MNNDGYDELIVTSSPEDLKIEIPTNFRRILDNSPDGVAISRDGETLYVNLRMGEILGDSIENIENASNYAYLHPESIDIVNSRIKDRLAGKVVPERYEVKIQRKDKTIRYVETNATRIIWEGKPAVLSFNRDITSFRSLEAKYEALLGHAAAMSMAETIEDIATITHDTVTQTIGFDRLSIGLVIGENLVHKYRWGVNSDGEFVMPLNGPGITVNAVNTNRTVNIGNILGDSGYVDGVGNLSTRSELAVPVIVETEAVAVLNIESENENAFSSTDQKLVEALAQQVASAIRRIDAQESQRKVSDTFNAFMESASESFVVFDSKLNFIDINQIGAERLGYPKEQILGRNMVDIMPELLESGRYKAYLEIIENGKPQVFDAIYHLTGIEHLRISAFKVGEGLGIIASDLSAVRKEQERRRKLDKELVEERFRTEQLIEMNRLKTNFMNTATHEIRTPITSVRGYSEIILGLLKRKDYEEVQTHFEAIIRNIDRLELLSRDLLDMQRIESGRMTIDRKDITVDSIVQQLHSEMTPILGGKDQILEVRNNVGDQEIFCDALRILQVLINLVNNSSKYSDYDSTIELIIEDEGSHILFTVKDKGLGLSTQDISKLFTPFPDIRIRNASHGTGLGLSISKGIIDLHGGTISAESSGQGQGSTFKFTISKR